MGYEIKLAREDNNELITDLLNKVTLQLHSKGIMQWNYPWNIKEIESEINNSHIYVVKTNNLIIGTFSLKNPDMKWLSDAKPNSLYLYRIAILPEYQGKNIGLMILYYVFEISKKNKTAIYLDCWAGNEKLKRFYSNAGFKYHGDLSEEDYKISVFEYN